MTIIAPYCKHTSKILIKNMFTDGYRDINLVIPHYSKDTDRVEGWINIGHHINDQINPIIIPIKVNRDNFDLIMKSFIQENVVLFHPYGHLRLGDFKIKAKIDTLFALNINRRLNEVEYFTIDHYSDLGVKIPTNGGIQRFFQWCRSLR